MNGDAIFGWLKRAVHGSRLIVDLPGGKSVTLQVINVSTDTLERLDMTNPGRQPDDFQQFMLRLHRSREDEV